jgi:hypothetical protein
MSETLRSFVDSEFHGSEFHGSALMRTALDKSHPTFNGKKKSSREIQALIYSGRELANVKFKNGQHLEVLFNGAWLHAIVIKTVHAGLRVGFDDEAITVIPHRHILTRTRQVEQKAASDCIGTNQISSNRNSRVDDILDSVAYSQRVNDKLDEALVTGRSTPPFEARVPRYSGTTAFDAPFQQRSCDDRPPSCCKKRDLAESDERSESSSVPRQISKKRAMRCKATQSASRTDPIVVAPHDIATVAKRGLSPVSGLRLSFLLRHFQSRPTFGTVDNPPNPRIAPSDETRQKNFRYQCNFQSTPFNGALLGSEESSVYVSDDQLNKSKSVESDVSDADAGSSHDASSLKIEHIGRIKSKATPQPSNNLKKKMSSSSSIRSDLPPPEQMNDWMASLPMRHRKRLAQGWRNSLGSKALTPKTCSGFRNVFSCGVNWQAKVSWQNKKYVVGVFKEAADGARAADRQAVKLGFLRHELNFPEEFERHQKFIKRGEMRDKSTVQDVCSPSLVTSHKILRRGVAESGTPPLFDPNDEEDFVKASNIKSGEVVARKVQNTTGYRGVYGPFGGNFFATVEFRGKKYPMYDFKTSLEAAKAYDAVAVTVGKAAVDKKYLNFPQDWTEQQIIDRDGRVATSMLELRRKDKRNRKQASKKQISRSLTSPTFRSINAAAEHAAGPDDDFNDKKEGIASTIWPQDFHRQPLDLITGVGKYISNDSQVSISKGIDVHKRGRAFNRLDEVNDDLREKRLRRDFAGKSIKMFVVHFQSDLRSICSGKFGDDAEVRCLTSTNDTKLLGAIDDLGTCRLYAHREKLSDLHLCDFREHSKNAKENIRRFIDDFHTTLKSYTEIIDRPSSKYSCGILEGRKSLLTIGQQHPQTTLALSSAIVSELNHTAAVPGASWPCCSTEGMPNWRSWDPDLIWNKSAPKFFDKIFAAHKQDQHVSVKFSPVLHHHERNMIDIQQARSQLLSPMRYQALNFVITPNSTAGCNEFRDASAAAVTVAGELPASHSIVPGFRPCTSQLMLSLAWAHTPTGANFDSVARIKRMERFERMEFERMERFEKMEFERMERFKRMESERMERFEKMEFERMERFKRMELGQMERFERFERM